MALLSNVGVPGSVFYLLFVASALGRRRGTPRTITTDVRLAARNACLGLIIGDIFAAPTVEQGLLFYVLAGIASAEPERAANWRSRHSAPSTAKASAARRNRRPAPGSTTAKQQNTATSG